MSLILANLSPEEAIELANQIVEHAVLVREAINAGDKEFSSKIRTGCLSREGKQIVINISLNK